MTRCWDNGMPMSVLFYVIILPIKNKNKNVIILVGTLKFVLV